MELYFNLAIWQKINSQIWNIVAYKNIIFPKRVTQVRTMTRKEWQQKVCTKITFHSKLLSPSPSVLSFRLLLQFLLVKNINIFNTFCEKKVTKNSIFTLFTSLVIAERHIGLKECTKMDWRKHSIQEYSSKYFFIKLLSNVIDFNDIN